MKLSRGTSRRRKPLPPFRAALLIAGATAAVVPVGGIASIAHAASPITPSDGTVTPDDTYSYNGFTQFNSLVVDSGNTLEQFSGSNYLLVNTSFTLGSTSAGVFLESAGTTACSTLLLGVATNSSGTVTLTGGSLASTAAYIGQGGIGDFYQGGGTFTTSALYLGGSAAADVGSFGVVSMSNGSSFVVSGNEYLGGGSSSIGIFGQSGGTHTVSGTIYIGYGSGSLGVLGQSGGTFSAPAVINSGILDISGGCANIGAISGTGQAYLGSSGTSSAMLTATSIAAVSLTIRNNSILSLSSSSPATNTISQLIVSGSNNAIYLSGTNASLTLGSATVQADAALSYGCTSGTSAPLSINSLTIDAAATFSLSSTSSGGFNSSTILNNGIFNISAGTASLGAVGGTGQICLAGVATATAMVQGALVNNGYTTINTYGNIGAVSGNGSLLVGTGGGTALMSVGSLQQGSVTVSSGAVLNVGPASVYFTSTNTGNLTVSSGGLTQPMIISGALTINNGGYVALNPSVPGSGVTHSVGSLSIAPSSNLDIGNHTVIVQNASDETVIGGYLANGYAAGYWNGISTSGGSITSIVAYNDNSGATSVGYGNSADFTGTPSPYGVGGPKALSGNQVVVQPALAGDLVLTGSVGANELAYMLNSYGTTSYDGSDKNTWAFGNIDYNPTGLVESNDLALLLLNYGATSSGFVAPKTAAVSHSAKTVTTLTGSASPAVNADGIELDVYLATGDVQINGNNATDVSTLYLVSPGAGMIGGTTFTAAFDALFPDNAINSNTEINPYATPGSASAVNGMVDMGDIYNTSLNTMDLLFQFSEKNENRGGLVSSTVVYIGVPEPTTLSLMGLAAAGLLARRRKKQSLLPEN